MIPKYKISHSVVDRVLLFFLYPKTKITNILPSVPDTNITQNAKISNHSSTFNGTNGLRDGFKVVIISVIFSLRKTLLEVLMFKMELVFANVVKLADMLIFMQLLSLCNSFNNSYRVATSVTLTDFLLVLFVDDINI